MSKLNLSIEVPDDINQDDVIDYLNMVGLLPMSEDWDQRINEWKWTRADD